MVLAVLVLLGQMAVGMFTAAAEQTPTFDEPVYVGTAAVYLHERSLRYNFEHPPLGKLVIAVGVGLAGPRFDAAFTGTQAAVGRHLLYESGNDPWRLMLAARTPMIVLTLLFGLVVFGFARELAGAVGGLLALALYAFCPDVIAHGSLANFDVAVAGFLLVCFWMLWRARRRPWRYLPLAGLALGAALATKMNALAAVPVVVVLAALSAWHAGGRRSQVPAKARLAAEAVAAAGVTAVIAVAVVWATYLAVDPQLSWARPSNVPAYYGLRGLAIDSLPLPEPYRDGVRFQFTYEDKSYPGYLFGEAYHGSRWYYLPAALVVKTPLGTLALALAGAVTLLAVRRLRAAAGYLLLPAGVILAAGMYGSRNFGVRYVIAVPVIGTVVAAAVLVHRRRWAPVVAAILALTVAISSVRAYPYYLPYSNEAFGGPANTYRHLHESNVDWGQDLGRLADHLARHYPGEQVWLVYRGAGVPAYYGIKAANPLAVPAEQVRGLLVVFNTSLAVANERLAALVDTSRRIDTVGHSITIFRRP